MEQPQLPYTASPIRTTRPKKPRDDHLRSCFEILPSEDDSTRIRCKYCNEYDKHVKRFNPTTSRTHLVMHCSGVDPDLRRTLMEGTQEFKRLKRLGEVVGDRKEDGEGTISSANSTTASVAGLNQSQLQSPQPSTTTTTTPNTGSKMKRMEMKEYTQHTVQQEKRTLERYWLDMWKDISREMSRLRKEMKEETDLEIMEDLHRDIRGLKRKKAEFARLLGMINSTE